MTEPIDHLFKVNESNTN